MSPDSSHVVCPQCAAVNRVPQQRLAESPSCGSCKAPLFAGTPVEFDEAAFDKHVTRSDLPVLVDFWAPWCGPCRAMAPAFKQAAAQLEPRMRLAKVNTDAEKSLAARYGIRSIPTLILFRGGREVARQAGALPLNALLQFARGAGH